MVLPGGKDMDISDEKLNEVDTVWRLVRDLSSNDGKTVDSAVKRADDYLSSKKSTFSRTVINKCDSNNSTTEGAACGQQSSEVTAFMEAVEKDATERSQRKARQKARAEKLKERANTFFKAGDWPRSIELYTQAIECCKDWEILYTNRAQAHLRSGAASAALADCDTALELYSFHQPNNPSDVNDSTQRNGLIAKTHFHRGKALMALDRPEDALTAYTCSRDCCVSKPTDGGWPAYLTEYVAQAQAAITAKQADARAEAEFSARTTQPTAAGETSVPLSTQLIGMLAKLARCNQDLTYYSSGLRQLSRLFSSAPIEAPSTPNHPTTAADPPTQPQTTLANSDQRAPTGRGRGKKRSSQASGKRIVSNGTHPAEPEVPPAAVSETLADLQTLFRVKKGFSIMGREVSVICQTVDQSSETATTHANGADRPSADSIDGDDLSDRLLALLNLTKWITCDCGENQRLLINQHPMLVHLMVNCMTLSPTFVKSLLQQDLCLSSLDSNRRHKLEALRNISTDLLIILSSEPSGRQALLNTVGAETLLNALALCLAESFGHQSTSVGHRSSDRSLVNGLQKLATAPRSSPTTASAISALCSAKAARILENLVESPGFLIAARSSSQSLESLLSVIEAALSLSGTGAARSLTTSTRSLSDLLDGLSGACHDDALRANIFQRRQPLLTALCECLQRHAPLLSDSGHAQLVGSLCRLLHNICVGQLTAKGEPNSLASYLTSSPRLTATLLDAVGTVLQQPGHGPELRAVAIALAGRVLPLCSAQRVLSWLGESAAGSTAGDTNNIPERGRLLLAILDSCSFSPTTEKSPVHNASGQEADRSDPDRYGQDQLSSHLLGGCVRCLAAATAHSITMRYAIGDDRRRVRRLARLVRAKLPNPVCTSQLNSKASVCSNPPVPRDETLAGNACLILQHCCDDTPLAENLQRTSIVLDLLQLIQESKSLDAKRNAAILIGKLAQANQDHRDELSRLDGWSVLTPFNSWSACLGRS